MFAVYQRFYNRNPENDTYGGFFRYFNQIIKLKKQEAGIREDEKPDVDEFVKMVLAGELKPQLTMKKPTVTLTPEQKFAEEQRIKNLLGLAPTSERLANVIKHLPPSMTARKM